MAFGGGENYPINMLIVVVETMYILYDVYIYKYLKSSEIDYYE